MAINIHIERSIENHHRFLWFGCLVHDWKKVFVLTIVHDGVAINKLEINWTDLDKKRYNMTRRQIILWCSLLVKMSITKSLTVRLDKRCEILLRLSTRAQVRSKSSAKYFNTRIWNLSHEEWWNHRCIAKEIHIYCESFKCTWIKTFWKKI